ncbi:MAG: hypothetical protein FJX93_04060, partial [Bacteroidetes bacterium]|nr:hypothetical protein [Bacteroidota bacterium]
MKFSSVSKKFLFLLTVFVNCVVASAQVTHPVITSFTPTSGATGTTVTITGQNFNATAANNRVYLGSVQVPITSASTTQLVVTIPAGTQPEKWTVLNTANAQLGQSQDHFVVTYANGTVNGTRTNFTTPSTPKNAKFIDLDGDGKLDMVSVNYGANTISVFRNTSTSGSISSSSFAAKQDFATASGPHDLNFGDLDGDGKVDIAVLNASAKNVSLFRNTSTSGSISLATKVDVSPYNNAVGYGYIYKMALGDLDRDGQLDIAVAGQSPYFTQERTIGILKNESTVGSFSFPTRYDHAVNVSMYDLKIVDLNADGFNDLVATNHDDNQVSIWRSLGSIEDISSSSFAARQSLTTGTTPYFTEVGDIDGDGKPEILVANHGSNTLSVFRNTSTSSALSFSAKVDFTAATNPRGIAIGDINGDGKKDVVVANYGSSSVSVFANTATSGSISTSSLAAKSDFTAGTNPNNLSIADIDGDGKLDWAVANEGSSSISVFRNSLPPTPPVVTSFSPTSGAAGSSVTITGLNFNATAANNVVYFGGVQATVTAASATQLTVTVPSGIGYDYITVLTTNNNLSGESSDRFTLTGDGVISYNQSTSLTTGSNPNQVAYGDLDGDGKPELIVPNSNSSSVSVFRNTSTSGSVSSSSFAAKADFTVGSGATMIAVGDIDGDGKLDLAVSNYNAGTVSILRNTSTGSGNINFAAKVDYSGFNGPRGVALGDLDGDGLIDLAVGTISGWYQLNGTWGQWSIVGLLKNSSTPGVISFDDAGYITGPNRSHYGVYIEDIDSDGKLDLVTANEEYWGGHLSIYRNTRSGITTLNSGHFASRVELYAQYQVQFAAFGDIDGDGKKDLICNNSNSNTVSVWRNNNPSGTITSANFGTRVDLTTGSYPLNVAIADLDGDGKPELLSANNTGGNFSVFKNQATSGSIVSGSFGARKDYTLGSNPWGITAVDVDKDGILDVVGSHASALKVFRTPARPTPPIITSFTPTSGATGTTVTITGQNFNATAANNRVYLGSVQVPITSAST